MRHRERIGRVGERVGQREVGVEVGVGDDAGNVAPVRRPPEGSLLDQTGPVARRWIVTILAAAVLVAAAVIVARAIRDDPATSSGATAVPSESSTTIPSAPVPSIGATTLPSSTTAAPATTAAAPPGPCGVDTGSIRAAIDAGVPNAAAAAELASCRVAASDPTWASVQLTARAGAQFDPVTVIVHGGAGSWAIVASGGPSAGCGRAPQSVIVDLGQFCAGNGGGGA